MEIPICVGKLEKEMIEFVEKYGSNITSQNGENGIIAEVLRRMKITGGIAAEFGAPTKSYCSNIHPIEGDWHKWYYDIDPQEPGITRTAITPENVNDWIHGFFLSFSFSIIKFYFLCFYCINYPHR